MKETNKYKTTKTYPNSNTNITFRDFPSLIPSHLLHLFHLLHLSHHLQHQNLLQTLLNLCNLLNLFNIFTIQNPFYLPTMTLIPSKPTPLQFKMNITLLLHSYISCRHLFLVSSSLISFRFLFCVLRYALYNHDHYQS